MKKGLLCFLLLCSVQTLYGQLWFQNSSEWTYNYNEWASSGHHVLSIHADTIIDGQACKILREDSYSSTLAPPNPGVTCYSNTDLVVYENNNQVFYAYTFEGVFRLMYDFNLIVGETIDFPDEESCDSTQSVYFILDSLHTETILGQSRIVQEGRIINTNYFPSEDQVTIIEGIGITQAFHLIPQKTITCQVDGPSFSLCNYLENNDNLYASTCELVGCPTPVYSTPFPNEELAVVPNPTSGWLQIDYPSDQELKSITVFSAEGKILQRIDSPETQIELDTDYQGLLILQFQFREGFVYKKIIKY